MSSTDRGYRAWLSVAEAADVIGVEHRTIRRMIANGSLPARRVGKTRVIRIAAVDLDRVMRPIPAPGQ